MIDLSIFTAAVSALGVGFFLMTNACWIGSKFYRPGLKKDLEHKPFLTVLIPAKDEEKSIPKTLGDLARQKSDNFEVVVLVNNCTDNTMREAKKFTADSRFRAVRIKGVKDKAGALNKGLRYARGDVIVVLDADTRLEEDFIEKIGAYFMDLRIDAVQPRYEIENKGENLLTGLQNLEFINFSVYNMGKCGAGESALAGGICMAVRRECIRAVGGWDSCLTEDYSFVSKLISKGYKVTLAKDVTVRFQGATTWSDLLRQRSRWVKGHLDLMKKNISRGSSLFDFLFAVAPVYNALLFAMFLLFYATLFFFKGQITYFYLPAWFWAAGLGMLFLLLADLCVTSRYASGIPLIPVYMVYSLHWILVLFNMHNTSWSNSRVARY